MTRDQMKRTKNQEGTLVSTATVDRNEIASRPLNEEEEIYKENILDHYKHPHNYGQLQEYTLAHREFNPLCGDDIIIYTLIQEGKIKDVSFQGKGCAISQASISLLTDYLKRKPLAEVKKLTPETVMQLLGIPISLVRMKCALLSLKAIHNGIKNMENTHE